MSERFRMRYILIGDGARLTWYVGSSNGLESYRMATLKQYYWQINEGKCFSEIPMCKYALPKRDKREWCDISDKLMMW